MTKKKDMYEELKKFRLKKKISLKELAEKTDYDEDYLEKIEAGDELVPVSVILDLSKALSISDEDLLMEKKEKKGVRKLLKQRKEGFYKRDDHYSYETLIPFGKSQHLHAFKVTINPQDKHQMVETHHPGEEFVYVLSGELTLKVGRQTRHLKADDSWLFDSTKSHHIENKSAEPAVFLVVLLAIRP
jgi:quercetin dioxygenase-like cupin family protein/DNA-binding Xre family transcriptional regulator